MTQQSSGVDLLLQSPAFLESVDAFNRHEWYAAHDSFEEIWYETTGQLREFLQALIQISVAEYHLDNGNTRGSILLMAEGLNHLCASRSLHTNYDLDNLYKIVRRRLLALQDNGGVPEPKPQLWLSARDSRSSEFILVQTVDC